MKKIGFVCYQYQWDHFLKFHQVNLKGYRYEPIIVSYELISRRKYSTLLNEFIALYKLLNENKCDLIISITPKLGFLISIVNLFTKFKHIHWFTGQIWANSTGLKLFIYKFIDKLTFILSDLTLCDSESQKDFLINHKIVTKSKCIVPHNGSICGFDQSLLSIPFPDYKKIVLILGVVGRICREKGSLDVIIELQELLQERKIQLIYFGKIDDNIRFTTEFNNAINTYPNIEFAGEFVDQLEMFKSIDILIQPSYREGFSNVVLEAQAAGRLVLCRDIYGLKSTFVDKLTGFEFKKGNLSLIVKSLLNDRLDIKSKSQNARNFVINKFSRTDVLNGIAKNYISVLND